MTARVTGQKTLGMTRLLVEHLPSALIIGVLGAFLFADWRCIPAALVAGWMLDADHLFDFSCYALRNRQKVDISLIRNGGYFKINQQVFVPLHSWELTAMLFLAGLFLDAPLLIVAAIAHGAHLLQDQIAYRVRFFGYSFISRAISRFSLSGFCGM